MPSEPIDDVFENRESFEKVERPKPDRQVQDRFAAYGGNPGVNNLEAAVLTLAEAVFTLARKR